MWYVSNLFSLTVFFVVTRTVLAEYVEKDLCDFKVSL